MIEVSSCLLSVNTRFETCVSHMSDPHSDMGDYDVLAGDPERAGDLCVRY